MNSIVFCLTIAVFYSSKGIAPMRDVSKNSPDVNLTKDTTRPKGADSEKSNNTTRNAVLGVWALPGDQNASFDIQKDRIIYIEDTMHYKYEIIKDSIRFDYGRYKVIYKVELKGKDTLVLTGRRDTIVYYRFKD
jgi:hypothetical protein